MGKVRGQHDGETSKQREDRKKGKKGMVHGEGSKQPREATREEPTAKELYKSLMAVEHKGTRFPHMETLQELGLFDDVLELYTQMGMRKFFQMAHPTYKGPLCQFLSTLKVEFYPLCEEPTEEEELDGNGYITFKVGRKHHRMSFKELNEVFGFEEGWRRGKLVEFRRDELAYLWRYIGIGTFKAGTSKSGSIPHPAVRYVHKALAHTFFARKECGYVTEDDFELMAMGFKNILKTIKIGSQVITLHGDGSGIGLLPLLLKKLLSCKEWAATTKDFAPQLSIGGIVTPILEACGADLGEVTHDMEWLDVSYLRKTRFLSGTSGGRHVYKFACGERTEARIRLPCPHLTSFSEKSNIRFRPSEDNLYNPSVDPPLQTTKSTRASTSHASAEPNQEEDQDEPLSPKVGSERYYFDPYGLAIPSQPLREAHQRINLLQRWNKYQDRTIRKMVKTIKGMAKEIKGLKTKFGGASSSRTHEPAHEEDDIGERAVVPYRRHSFHEQRESTLHEDQPRSSSYEARQRKRKPMRSPTPESSNQSYSMEESSSSSSSAQF